MEPFGKLVGAGGGVLTLPANEPDAGALMMAIKEKNPDFNADKFKLKE